MNGNIGANNRPTLFNKHGIEFYSDVAITLMNKDILDRILNDFFVENDQELFTLYEEEHERIFGEEWELSKRNPIY